MAATYPCSNVDLLSFTPLATFAATSTNSLWGWTDPNTGQVNAHARWYQPSTGTFASRDTWTLPPAPVAEQTS